MKKMIFLLILLSGFNFAYAGKELGNGGDVETYGKELGNGGNNNVLGFYSIAMYVDSDISREPAKYPEVPNGLLSKIIHSTKFLVSEVPLYVDYKGICQEAVAVNYKNPNRIVIDSKKWLALTPNEQKSLAFHELLGLAGLESTGDYRISARYFASNQIDIYNCIASDETVTESFTLSDPKTSTTKTYLTTVVNGVTTQSILIIMGPGLLDPMTPSSDSTYIQINRMQKGATDWENIQTTTFFGDPKLPRRFQLELDKSPPYSTSVALTCQVGN